MSNSGRGSRGKDLRRMRLQQSKKGSTSKTKSASIPKRRTTQEISLKNIPHRVGFLTSDIENNTDSSSSSSSASSSSTSSASNSSSEGSVSSEEESGNEADLTSINKNPGIFCDWHSVHCDCSGPGYKNLELKQCQHPGGTCNKLVHHLCTINWGMSKGVPDDIGYTCREHTPAFIEISRQFNPQPEITRMKTK